MAGSNSAWNVPFGTVGQVLISNGAGVVPTFSATPALTSMTFGAGTALSTFVQNTFTPALSFGGASVSITYGTQLGEYTQIGNVVCFSIQLVLTSKGSSVGAAAISLPVASGGTPSSVASGRFAVITLDALFTMIGGSISGSSLALYENGSAQTATVLADTHFANNSTIYISGTYFTS